MGAYAVNNLSECYHRVKKGDGKWIFDGEHPLHRQVSPFGGESR
jgi:hypothetical protein